jgi:hypothetical protein
MVYLGRLHDRNATLPVMAVCLLVGGASGAATAVSLAAVAVRARTAIRDDGVEVDRLYRSQQRMRRLRNTQFVTAGVLVTAGVSVAVRNGQAGPALVGLFCSVPALTLAGALHTVRALLRRTAAAG